MVSDTLLGGQYRNTDLPTIFSIGSGPLHYIHHNHQWGCTLSLINTITRLLIIDNMYLIVQTDSEFRELPVVRVKTFVAVVSKDENITFGDKLQINM